MKRIIYSLVLMLSIGGILTSCIENVEPAGVKEMRTAHAEFLRACAELKKADALVREADARYRDAQTRLENALALQEEIEADMMEVDLKLMENRADAEIAKIKAELEVKLTEIAADLADAQKELAYAEKDLADALAAIEIESLAMSAEEQAAFNAIKKNYLNALDEYQKALDDRFADGYSAASKLEALASDTIIELTEKDYVDDAVLAHVIQALNDELDYNQLSYDFAEHLYNFWSSYDPQALDFVAEMEAYTDSVNMWDMKLAAANEELEIAKVQYEKPAKAVYDAAIEANGKAETEAINAASKAFGAAVKGIDKSKYVEDAKGKLSVDPESLKNDYTAAQKIDFDHPFVMVYAAYAALANKYVDDTAFGNDTLKVVAKGIKNTAALDTIAELMYADNALGDGVVGLQTMYDDFSRSLLDSWKVDSAIIAENADAIQDAVDDLRADYEYYLSVLTENAPKNEDGKYLKDLIKAYNAKKREPVDAYNEAFDVLINTWHAFTATPSAPKKYAHKISGVDYETVVRNSHIWSDASSMASDSVAIVENSKGFSAYNNIGNVYACTNVSGNWFTGTFPTAGIYQSVTTEDTLTVLNAYVNYWKAAEAINSLRPVASQIPAERFEMPIYAYDTAIGFNTENSIKYSEITIDDLRLKSTNPAASHYSVLYTKGILLTSRLDNKGVDVTATPVDVYSSAYEDGLQRLIKESANDGLYVHGIISPVSYTDMTWEETLHETGSKHAQLVAEAKAGDELAAAIVEWVDACYFYYGVEGYELRDRVYFDIDTFGDENHNNVVLFDDLMLFTINTDGTVTIPSFTSDASFVSTSQLKAVLDMIYWINDAPLAFSDWFKSIVFPILYGEWILDLNESKTLRNGWTLLQEAISAIEADLMDQYEKNIAAEEKANEEVAKYNAALDAFNAATADAVKAQKAADKAAKDAYDAVVEEYIEPIEDEIAKLTLEYAYYYDMLNAISDGYSLIGDDLMEYIIYKKSEALKAMEATAAYMASLQFQIDEILGLNFVVEPGSPEAEAALKELVAILDAIVDEIESLNDEKLQVKKEAYEYWAAAFDAACKAAGLR